MRTLSSQMPNQKFDAKMNIHMYWWEKGITQAVIDANKFYQEDSEVEILEEHELEKLCVQVPNLTLNNGSSEETYSSVKRLGKDLPVGIVHWELRIRATFSDSFDLHEFPFDAQDLCMELRINSKRDSTRKRYARPLQLNDPGVVLREEMILPEWRTYAPRSECKKMTFFVHCIMRRKHRYYTYNVIVNNSMLTTIGLTAYLIPPHNYGDRASTLLTLLLTSVAFKFLVSAELPKTPYFTLLDKFMFAAFFFLILVLIQNALVCYAIMPGAIWNDDIPTPERIEAATYVDRVCFYFFTALWTLANLLYFLYIHNHLQRLCSQLGEDYQGEGRRDGVKRERFKRFDSSWLSNRELAPKDSDSPKKDSESPKKQGAPPQPLPQRTQLAAV